MAEPAMNRGRLIWLALALAGGVAAVALIALHQYRQFLDTPLRLPESGMVVIIEHGDNLTTLIRRLEGEGITQHDWRWRLLARSRPVAVQAGEFMLSPPMRPADLLALLHSGRVLQHRFTIVEGWTWRQLLLALAADPVLEKSIEGVIHPAEFEVIAESVGASNLDHAEGWFLPETYYFIRGESDVDILRRAHDAMKQSLADAWQNRGIGLPLETPYELLILASIVEKETALEEERNQIAGVLVRRLQRGMRLQTDPTVIYGLGESFDGNIRRRDLRSDTPYNTYTRTGLPPTPIALAGHRSLMAAANPSDGEALYFVANGDGGHTFSATLEEHEEAVRKLIERQ